MLGGCQSDFYSKGRRTGDLALCGMTGLGSGLGAGFGKAFDTVVSRST